MPTPLFEKGNAGRPKGTPNKIPAKIKELCLKAAPDVIAELKRLMQDKNPMVRLAACNAILDRGIGKAAQPIVGEGDGPVEVRHIISWIGDVQPKVVDSCARLPDKFIPEDPLPWQN
jgi:hypothetical protein